MNKLAILGAIVILGAGGAVVAGAGLDTLQDKGSHFERVLVNDLIDVGVSKVELMKDQPKVILSKWNDEVRLGVSYNKVDGKGKKVLLSNRIEWKDSKGKEELHAYPIDDSTYEIEVILNEKPTTNVFDFTIDGVENLDFFYQPELTAEEIAEGASRPENVIGSYAVYHKTKANHRIGDINYTTGKAFHIFRPKAIDANGVEVWASLGYSNGMLRVIVPQSFLDSATYPVRVDPTFGYTTIGGTNSSLAVNTVRASQSFSAPENGVLTGISFYCNVCTGTTVLRGALYQDSNKALIGNAGLEFRQTNPGTGFHKSTMPSNTLVASTVYDIAVWFSTNSWGAVYDSNASYNLLRDDLTYHATNNPNDPFVTDSTLTSRVYSIYATYTASGGATVSPKVLINTGQIIINTGTVVIP